MILLSLLCILVSSYVGCLSLLRMLLHILFARGLRRPVLQMNHRRERGHEVNMLAEGEREREKEKEREREEEGERRE